MTSKPKIALFDLDSTLAHTADRWERFGASREGIDWTAYAMACSDDPPTHTVALALLLQDMGLAIGGVSFRPEVAREVSLNWSVKQGLDFAVLKLLDHEAQEDHEVVPFKIRAVSEVMEEWEVVLFVEDQWRTATAVQEALGVPSMVVSSYPPKVREMSF